MLNPPGAAAPDMLQMPYAGCAAHTTVAYRDGVAVDNRAFRARTAAWQQLLAAHAGKRFALFLADTLDFSCALYGAWLAGKTVYLPGDTLHASCAALSAAVDGFLGDFDPAWKPLTPAAALDANSAAIDADDTDTALDRPLSAEFEGIVVYTSGSSGAAQAIPKRLAQLAAEVATLERSFGARIGAADILATVSHQHIYGLLFKVLWPLATQRPMHVRSAVFLEELLPWMRSRPCVLVSSPAHLTRFPHSAALPVSTPASAATSAPAEDFAQLRAVFSSGGPLPAQAADDAAALFGGAPIEIYGSSETGGIAWRSRANASSDESWTPLPGIQWRLHADDSALEVRSPHLPDANWLRMADRAVATVSNPASDPDPLSASAIGAVPRFLLQGRIDRIVKLAEKRISLDAIERNLCASPLVTAARVLLLPPPQRAGIAAFVVLSDSGRATLAANGKLALNRQLKAALSGAVEAIALPRRWRYPDALPINAQGKTTQTELLALLDVDVEAPRPTMPELLLHRQDEHNVLLEMRIGADLLYFDGHFDAAPILPGVAQLNWAMILGRRYFDLPPVFCAVHALKFQQVITPDSTVMLELRHDPAKASLHFQLQSSAGRHASGRIEFTQAGHHV